MKIIRNKIAVTFVLVLALVMGMSTSVFAGTEGETEASVLFTQDPTYNKLELVTAPGFDFGSRTLPEGSETISSEAIDGVLKISDTRGKYDGWQVSAKLSNFSTDTVSDSMPGAYINLLNGKAEKDGAGATKGPSVVNNITLVSGAEDVTPIADAEANAGIGAWNIKWEKENAALTVLDPPSYGANKATIKWTLLSAPN